MWGEVSVKIGGRSRIFSGVRRGQHRSPHPSLGFHDSAGGGVNPLFGRTPDSYPPHMSLADNEVFDSSNTMASIM
mgnify:CR=1 FL=1